MSNWIPRIGWEAIDAESAREMGLPVRQKWEVFRIEWFGQGWIFKARARP